MQTARALPPPSAQLLCQRINWQICHKKSIARAGPIKTELPLHGQILKVDCAVVDGSGQREFVFPVYID